MNPSLIERDAFCFESLNIFQFHHQCISLYKIKKFKVSTARILGKGKNNFENYF